MENGIKSIKDYSVGALIAKLITFISIIVYSIGYLINTIFLKSFGSISVPIIKSDFIFTGIVFSIVSLSFIVLPLLYFVIRGIKKIRSKPSKPLVGLKRSYLIVLNYCLILIIYTMYITREEWIQQITILNSITIPLREIFLVFFVGVLIGIVVISIFERACQSLEKKIVENKWFGVENKDHRYIELFNNITNNFIGFWRFFFLFVSLVMDYLLIVKIHWFFKVFWAMKFYFGMTFIMVFALFRIRNVKKESDRKNNHKLSKRIVMIGYTFIPILIFLMVFSYSFSVFRLMPKNRGGMMPLYKTIFYLKNYRDEYNEILDHTEMNSIIKTKAVYLLFSDTNYYYVSECYPLWKKNDDNEYMENVYMIRTSNVLAMKRVRSNPRYDMCNQKS